MKYIKLRGADPFLDFLTYLPEKTSKKIYEWSHSRAKDETFTVYHKECDFPIFKLEFP
jgi:hypothetical protein